MHGPSGERTRGRILNMTSLQSRRRAGRYLSKAWYLLIGLIVDLAPLKRHRLARVLLGMPLLQKVVVRLRHVWWPIFPQVESTWSLPLGVKDRGPQVVFHGMTRHADALIDGGANLGWYSCLAAAAGIDAILAVEPVAPTARMLGRIARWNGFSGLRVVRCAIGDRQGVARFAVPEMPFPEMGHLGDDVEGRVRDVPILTLSDLLEMLGPEKRQIIVKLDVEGHELAVMRGGIPARYRERIAAFLIEVHLAHFESPAEALSALADGVRFVGCPMVMVPDDPSVGPIARCARNATGNFPLILADDASLRCRVAARELREVYLIAQRDHDGGRATA